MPAPRKIATYTDPETGEQRVEQHVLDAMIKLGEEGKWTAHYAKEFGVSKRAIGYWRGKYPEFAEAFEIATTAAQVWWEDKGRENLTQTAGSTFNQTIWLRTLAAHARDEWMERHESIQRDGDRADLATKTDEELDEEIARVEAQRAAREAARENAAKARERAKARDA